MDASELADILAVLAGNLGAKESIRTIWALALIGSRRNVTQDDITKEIGLTKANASQLMRRLRESELVDSMLHETERRKRALTLTKTGVLLLTGADVIPVQAYRKGFAPGEPNG